MGKVKKLGPKGMLMSLLFYLLGYELQLPLPPSPDTKAGHLLDVWQLYHILHHKGQLMLIVIWHAMMQYKTLIKIQISFGICNAQYKTSDPNWFHPVDG